MENHRDKNGIEIGGQVGIYLQHDDGRIFERFGTGLNYPREDAICCWRPDNDPRKTRMPIVWVKTRRLRVYDTQLSGASPRVPRVLGGFLAVLSLLIILSDLPHIVSLVFFCSAVTVWGISATLKDGK